MEFQSTLGGQLNTGIDNVMIYDTPTTTTAPEPASIALVASGLVGVAVVGRRRRK